MMNGMKGIALISAGLLLSGVATADSKKAGPKPAADSSEAVEIKEVPTETLRLGLGMQKSLTVKGLRRIAVGNPSVADATVLDKTEILLTGVAEGETSLIVWMGKDSRAAYRVKVMKKTPEETAEELRALLGN